MSLFNQLGRPKTLEEKLQQQMLGGPAPIVERSEYSRNMPPAPQQAPVQKPSFFQKAREKLADPAYRAQMAAAFNTMRMNPDPTIAQRAVDMSSANKTVQYLEQQGQTELANAVRANPELATDAMKSIIGTNYARQYSTVQIDPMTGQKYVTEADPNTRQVRRIDIEGAVGETASEKAAREIEIANLQAGRDAARVRGEDYFDNAQAIGRSINIMQDARDLASSEDGVVTGVLEQFLPAFDANTRMFISLQADLGIAVINSATFGALSEAELRLALNKDIPRGLEGQELINYLDKKIAAQNKLYREMNRKARRLQSGITLGEYMEEQQAEIDENYATLADYPQGDPNMTYQLWSQMSANDRKAYKEAGE